MGKILCWHQLRVFFASWVLSKPEELGKVFKWKKLFKKLPSFDMPRYTIKRRSQGNKVTSCLQVGSLLWIWSFCEQGEKLLKLCTKLGIQKSQRLLGSSFMFQGWVCCGWTVGWGWCGLWGFCQEGILGGFVICKLIMNERFRDQFWWSFRKGKHIDFCLVSCHLNQQ